MTKARQSTYPLRLPRSIKASTTAADHVLSEHAELSGFTAGPLRCSTLFGARPCFPTSVETYQQQRLPY
jgi:hypothetical protein